MLLGSDVFRKTVIGDFCLYPFISVLTQVLLKASILSTLPSTIVDCFHRSTSKSRSAKITKPLTKYKTSRL